MPHAIPWVCIRLRPKVKTGCTRGNVCSFGNAHLICKMVAQNADVTDREIATKLKVAVTHSPIEYEALDRALRGLEVVRISPILNSRVAVDDYSEYDSWYDGWQEAVHYTITGPFMGAPRDQLVQWMLRFRASLPDLMKSHSAPNGSKLK